MLSEGRDRAFRSAYEVSGKIMARMQDRRVGICMLMSFYLKLYCRLLRHI